MLASRAVASNAKIFLGIFVIITIFYQNIFLRSPMCEILVDESSPLFSHHRFFTEV
jgi:hypothetical protein